MLKQTLNELQVVLEIQPESPLLVKDGRHFERKEGETGEEWKERKKDRIFFHQGVQRTPRKPRKKKESGYGSYDNADDCFDMACVFTRDAQGENHFYLPGSSLRGVMRSTAERLVGRWQPDLVHQSDPFDNREEKWVQDRRKEGESPDSATIYRRAGPIDRCFGHAALRGHWRIADAWMQDDHKAKVVVRDGVGINRTTGAAQNDVKFQFEAITGGVFITTLTLVNYELWQLGLLAHVLAALDEGEVRMGYGTRRGLGRVRVRVQEMVWRWYHLSHEQQPGARATARITIPSLHSLANEMQIEETYGWMDGHLTSPVLDIMYREGTLVPDMVLHFPNTPSNWDSTPWDQFGPLLPEALETWPVSAEEVTP